jgi:hypothetical protein
MDMQIEKGLKTFCFETLIIIAPPIGESCKFDAMISIINGAKT